MTRGSNRLTTDQRARALATVSVPAAVGANECFIRVASRRALSARLADKPPRTQGRVLAVERDKLSVAFQSATHLHEQTVIVDGSCFATLGSLLRRRKGHHLGAPSPAGLGVACCGSGCGSSCGSSSGSVARVVPPLWGGCSDVVCRTRLYATTNSG